MSLAKAPTASSISTGFFQGYPVIPPAYTRVNDGIDHDTGDTVLTNIVRLYLPFPLPSELDQSLHDFARQCLDPETLRLSVDAENNQPTLHSLTTFGGANNINPLRTSEGWKALKDIQTRAGIVAHGYKYDENGTYNRRSFQFALSHLWSSSSAGVTCPAAMSDGAAILIARHLSRRDAPIVAGQNAATLHRVLTEAHARLTSFDPAYAWTSGQWMTERPGGSDVSRTETLARLASPDDLAADSANYGGQSIDAVDMPLGPYIVDGFKWFSSATDADMVVLLAQSEKGLSAFYAPMKRTSIAANGKTIHVMNGVRISRLKNKLGTKALPTAELEIKGMRAWLLGEEGKGVREISAILNATRLWTAVGATAGWGRGLTISKAYAKVRKIKGEHFLVDNRQHLRWIADETVKYRACVHFAHFGVALLGLSEADDQTEIGGMRTRAWLPQSQNDASLLLRILTPVMKAQCSLWSTLGLRECMESLGGVGYCENQEDDGLLNLARIFRDSAVNSIWEGTTNILAEDFVRSIKSSSGTQALSVLDSLLESMLKDTTKGFQRETAVTRQAWANLRSELLKKSSSELLYHGRDLLQRVQIVVSACLLMLDATHWKRRPEWLVAQRWVSTYLLPKAAWLDDIKIKDEIEGDRLIFDGIDRCHSKTGHQSRL